MANLASGKLTLSPAGRTALAARPADTLKSIWKKWLAYRGFDELRRIDVIKGQTGRGKNSLTAPVKRRAAIRTLILHDRRTKSLCYSVGEQHIAVPTEKENAFARAVRELGYLLGR